MFTHFILALAVFAITILWETYVFITKGVIGTDYKNKKIYIPKTDWKTKSVLFGSVLVQIITYNLDNSLGKYFIYSNYAILIFLVPTVILSYYMGNKIKNSSSKNLEK